MPLRYSLYIADNPFRLCGVGSATPLAELRQNVKDLEMKTKVGLPLDSSLANLFGIDEAAQCAAILRTLSNEPERLALYRIFWPLTYEHLVSPTGTLADLDGLINREADGSPAMLQGEFLAAWYSFLAEPNASPLVRSLEAFDEWYSDADSDELLAQVLQRDRVTQPMEVLYRSQNQALNHLLTTACRAVADCWDEGDTSKALELLNAIVVSDDEEGAAGSALRSVIVPLGERERARVEREQEDYAEWTPEQGLSFISTADALSRLAAATSRPLGSIAVGWAEQAENYRAKVYLAMRSYAIDAWNEREDWKQALSVMQRLLGLQDAHGLHKRIREDLSALYGNMAGQALKIVEERGDLDRAKEILTSILQAPVIDDWHNRVRSDLAAVERIARRNRKFPGLRPIKILPTLRTVNGLGTVLYRDSPFRPKGDDGYLATEYFCIFFVPIFALARFVVSDAPGGGWHFHGTVPLSRRNEFHTLASCVLATGLALYLTFGDSVRKSGGSQYLNTYSQPSSSEPDALDQAAAEVQRAKEQAQQERLARLTNEQNQLVNDIESAASNLAAESSSIKTARQELESELARLKVSGTTVDTNDNASVDRYNAAVRRARSSMQSFNRRVVSYNERIRKNKSRRARLGVVHQALIEAQGDQ